MDRAPVRCATWLVIATVCFGAFMGQLDASIVTMAFPAMSEHFGRDPEWISISYLITLVALLVPMGRIADRVGRKIVYIYGFALFTAASVACVYAPNFDTLIAARVGQAIGAAMLQANSVALVTTNVEPEKRRKALGIQAAAQAIGLAAGPLLGGYLVEHHGWQSVFAINVPIGVVAMIAGHYLLPRTRRARKPERRPSWKVLPGLAGVLLTYAVLFAPMTLLPFAMKQPLAHIGLTVAALPLGFAIAATLLHKPNVTTGALLAATALILPVPQVLQLIDRGHRARDHRAGVHETRDERASRGQRGDREWAGQRRTRTRHRLRCRSGKSADSHFPVIAAGFSRPKGP